MQCIQACVAYAARLSSCTRQDVQEHLVLLVCCEAAAQWYPELGILSFAVGRRRRAHLGQPKWLQGRAQVRSQQSWQRR